ncbi:MAG: HNH endonuclease [Methylocella sp.]
MTKQELLTHERLKEVLHYDPETGLWIWREKTAPKSHIQVGDEAGDIQSNGYVRIQIDGLRYLAHRLAVFYMTGRWPEHQVDHWDLNKSNNRWSNLREATNGQNMANTSLRRDSSSSFKGVSRHSDDRKWWARIQVRGRRIYLGCFDTREDAHAAYIAAAAEHFGEYARAA